MSTISDLQEVSTSLDRCFGSIKREMREIEALGKRGQVLIEKYEAQQRERKREVFSRKEAAGE